MQKMKQLMVRGGVVLGSLGLLAGQAMAEVPAEVTSSLNAAKADGVAIGGVVLGVIIAIAAFKYIRRAL
ncbi:TPA: phage coat protein [Pseudomonas aeruginosa]|uniref:major capsid protein n=1 Tax=Pseudomonas aeruginosa TaxID=287 RepID=UPI0021E5413D|nr:major capsid protein [Pseudomonas aeruginosa]UYH35850.1 major capsid protein [Pseudomonas aeruginosa]UYH35862.1 major capsid protein [Pseudomonas aeruginosa]UYH35874.1 major capsid protein [Pseudomonas aeruginosa]UYH35886.1 major capsid protein [Pseudomonas aeruginosa]HCE1178329.1 phage coat protein [Pseudomonas aeruginosa]